MANTISNVENHILIGLGGTGGKILRQFKMRMFEEFPNEEERRKQPVTLLYVDSTREDFKKGCRVMGMDASFTEREFLDIKAIGVEQILANINSYPTLKGIVDNVEATGGAIGNLGEAAGQMRRAGRLLFAVNATQYVKRIQQAYNDSQSKSGEQGTNNIHIFAGLSGGTGSGSIVDAVAQARKTFPKARIYVYAMLPEMNLPYQGMDQGGRYYPNGYAAMRELNALQTGRWCPQDVTGKGPLQLYSDSIKGVADGLTIYSNVNENGIALHSHEQLPKVVSDFMFLRIFCINYSTDHSNDNVKRAFSYENMDACAIEFDETGVDASGKRIKARTKKVSSFGIKRVMYPELRILKHITYTIGESVLYQFRYNNWLEGMGYINDAAKKDYRSTYLNPDNLAKWMLDNAHLTLEAKILTSDPDYPTFKDYWHDKAVGYAEEAKKAECPLNELDSILNTFFTAHFRDVGADQYYATKERAIPDMAREVRQNIERDLFGRWQSGDISIEELKKVSTLLMEKISEIRMNLEKDTAAEKEYYSNCDSDRQGNVDQWTHLGLLQRMVNVGARLYAEHQDILGDYYESKTKIVAYEFAKKLAAKIETELGHMDSDISAFQQKINDAIDALEKLIGAQRKVNKGLEDMKGAIIEVSEDEAMVTFEKELQANKLQMPVIARQLREAIVPAANFISFGDVTNKISIDSITTAFDLQLTLIIKEQHNDMAESDKKVLGLNILTQLQQKLQDDDAIKAFAKSIVRQSGVYLDLNEGEISKSLPNNEGPLDPAVTSSARNQKTMLISIPSPEGNDDLKRFADKLAVAFENATSDVKPVVNMNSPRKDELSIITLNYQFPMRAIEWMTPYRLRYENFLDTGNENTNRDNAILLHSEGYGDQLPKLFVQDQQQAAPADYAQPVLQVQPAGAVAGNTMPQIPGATVTPPMPGAAVPPPIAEPEIQLHISANGQAYGPYNRETCKQFVKTGQLSPQSLVWMEGMQAWQPASEVQALQSLFAPAAPPMPTPPLPGGGVPPAAPPAM